MHGRVEVHDVMFELDDLVQIDWWRATQMLWAGACRIIHIGAVK